MYPLEGQKTDIAALNKVKEILSFILLKFSILDNRGKRSTNFNVKKKS